MYLGLSVTGQDFPPVFLLHIFSIGICTALLPPSSPWCCRGGALADLVPCALVQQSLVHLHISPSAPRAEGALILAASGPWFPVGSINVSSKLWLPIYIDVDITLLKRSTGKALRGWLVWRLFVFSVQLQASICKVSIFALNEMSLSQNSTSRGTAGADKMYPENKKMKAPWDTGATGNRGVNCPSFAFFLA